MTTADVTLASTGRTVPATFGPPTGPLGHQRRISRQILLSIATLGLYGAYWTYVSHEEVRRRSDAGAGGVLGVLIGLFAGVITLFLLPIEIQRMYERDGMESPVRASTAAWFLLFGVPWYIKCQRALNQYWAANGAPAAS
jgi:hypothetical protein